MSEYDYRKLDFMGILKYFSHSAMVDKLKCQILEQTRICLNIFLTQQINI